MRHEANSPSSAYDVAGGNSGKRVSRRNDRSALQHSHGPSLAARPQDGDAIEVPEGDIRCTECAGDAIQYRIDFGVDCPTCRGTGHHADPDYYDAVESFDPYREFGTMPSLHGRGRGQL